MERAKINFGCCSRCDFDLGVVGYSVNGYPISCIIPRSVVNSQRPARFEKLDNGSLLGGSFEESKIWKIVYYIEIDNLSNLFFSLLFPSLPAMCSLEDNWQKKQRNPLAKARCNVRDQRMGSKPQLFSFYPDAFNSFVNLSPVPLSQQVVTLIQTSRFCSCTRTRACTPHRRLRSVHDKGNQAFYISSCSLITIDNVAKERKETIITSLYSMLVKMIFKECNHISS